MTAPMPFMCRWFGHSFTVVFRAHSTWDHPSLLEDRCRRCGRTPDEAATDGGFE